RVRTPSAAASRDTCVSSCRNPFRLRRDFLPCPAALEPHDAALLPGRIDDEDECVVQPVVEPFAPLVSEAEADVEAPVREGQLVDLEPCRELGRLRVPAELRG